MAPISTQSPSALSASISRRIKDIRDFQLPRLRSCPGPITLHQQYASELREDIEGIQRSLKLLEVAVDDEEKESDREKTRQNWEELTNELNELRRDTRAAVLSSKRSIDAKINRSELLSGLEKDTVLEKSEDALMNKSNEVTLALRRTMQLMQQEVERSVLSTQMLDESSRTLHSTSNSYVSLSSLLDTSKALITALERADWMDRALILAAFLFFLLVVGFILKQRIFDRGVRLAFWWVKYLPSFGEDELAWDTVQDSSTELVTTVLTTTFAAAATTLASGSAHVSHTGTTLVMETVTSTVIISRTPQVEATPSLESAWQSDSVMPSHTLSVAAEDTLDISPTDAPQPEPEELPLTPDDDPFPQPAVPLEKEGIPATTQGPKYATNRVEL